MLNVSGENVRGGTGALSSAGLGIGSTPAELSIAATDPAGVHYMINGYSYYLANDATVAMTAMAVQAVSTSCLYLVQLESDGTLSTVKGTERLTADITSGKSVLEFPQADSVDKAVIGGFRVDTNATVPYTGGTTDLDAAGITDTYYNFGIGIPDAPLTA